MGIDWITERKPLNGKEKEFIKLQKYLHKLLNEENTSNKHEELIKHIESNFYNISYSPQDVLQCYNNIDITDIYCGDNIFESNLIDEELKEEACNNHNALQTIDFANRIQISIQNIDINKLDEDDKEDYNNVIDGIKWLKFWGENGHGFVVYY